MKRPKPTSGRVTLLEGPLGPLRAGNDCGTWKCGKCHDSNGAPGASPLNDLQWQWYITHLVNPYHVIVPHRFVWKWGTPTILYEYPLLYFIYIYIFIAISNGNNELAGFFGVSQALWAADQATKHPRGANGVHWDPFENFNGLVTGFNGEQMCINLGFVDVSMMWEGTKSKGHKDCQEQKLSL
jgi:hypothetical protein